MPIRRLVFLVVVVSTSFVAGLVLTGRLRSAEQASARPVEAAAPPRAAARPGARAARGGSWPDFTAVAAQTVKAVTNISSLQYVRAAELAVCERSVLPVLLRRATWRGDRSRRELSLGSGVIVSPTATSSPTTTSSASRDAGRRSPVVFGDKREVRAQVVGIDDWTDIALLKVNLTGLPVMPWGDSSKLKVAEWVLAIGNPFQLSQTVTLGIVSALGRANIGAATYEDFIQTDAAINPGNSGGALVNARGELIGINTAIYSQSGGYQGIGFAVPSNLARRVMDDLIRYGEVRRGSIGAARDHSADDRSSPSSSGCATSSGAVVARMSRSSAAYPRACGPAT